MEGNRNEIQVGNIDVPKEDDDIEEIPRQPRAPHEDMLNPVDGYFLQHYVRRIHDHWIYRVVWSSSPEDHAAGLTRYFGSLGHDVFQRFGLNLPSMAVRYAVLLVSLQIRKCWYPHLYNDSLEMEYKDRFYRAMHRAISIRAYTDVLYASYFACLRGVFEQTTSSLDEFITNFKGFISVLMTAAPAYTQTETLSAVILLANVLQWMDCSMSARFSFTEDIYQSIEAAYIALKSGNGAPQGCQTTYGRCLRQISYYIEHQPNRSIDNIRWTMFATHPLGDRMSLTDKLSVTGSEFPVADGALDATLIAHIGFTGRLSRRANTIYTSTRWGDLVVNRATSKAG
jgi:hypothetical protein